MIKIKFQNDSYSIIAIIHIKETFLQAEHFRKNTFPFWKDINTHNLQILYFLNLTITYVYNLYRK